MVPFVSLFFFTNYLFILFAAGWYTFKRVNDVLIRTLGPVVVLWVENPVKGNFAYIDVAGQKART